MSQSVTEGTTVGVQAAPPTPAKLAVLMVVAAVVGLIAGLGASGFLKVEHELQHLLWTSLPDAIGQPEAPGWLVFVLLLTGALIVFGASKLPGHGGHHPLQPFSLDIDGHKLGSALIAALGTLSFGAVLGPEAPLFAVGTGLAAIAIRKPGQPMQQVMMLTGAMAAVSAIFGNPLITAVLLLEFAIAAGPAMASTPVLLAALTGMAASYTLQVGIGHWSGLGEAQLGLPGLAPYTEVATVDVLVAVPLAIVVGVLAMLARLGALRIAALAAQRPLPVLLGGALAVALCATGVRASTGGSIDLVLFSGQVAMPDYLALTSVGTALVILVGKLLGYIVSLGSGFRGGAIFPAVAVGALLATIATLIVPGTSVSALAATAIAAATAAVLRLPFTALLLGVMLTYPAGGATTVLAVVGTVVGILTRLAGERRMPVLAPPRRG